MKLRALLAAKGIHYLATRFGWKSLKQKAFDEKYRRGDWKFTNDSGGELAETVRKHLHNGDLLIMGCGGAAVLHGLEQQGLSSAIGIDLSEEALRLADKYKSQKVSFQQADMTQFTCPYPFDVILFSESLNYVASSEQVSLLKRLGENLKSNGVIVVTFAQARRYDEIISRLRSNFNILEDRPFRGSERHLLVFTL